VDVVAHVGVRRGVARLYFVRFCSWGGGLKDDRAPLLAQLISLPLISVCVYKVFDAVFKFEVEHVTGSASS
jgi:hypothetical protein